MVVETIKITDLQEFLQVRNAVDLAIDKFVKTRSHFEQFYSVSIGDVITIPSYSEEHVEALADNVKEALASFAETVLQELYASGHLR